LLHFPNVLSGTTLVGARDLVLGFFQLQNTHLAMSLIAETLKKETAA
jgi:hypothetical protein